MSVGLSHVAVRLPRGFESVDDIMARAGCAPAERKMFAKVFGLRQSPTLAEDEYMPDLLLEAGQAALDGATAQLVLYGHTLLTQEFGLRGGFPDKLRAGLGLPDAAFYGLSHVNCTSVLRCVEFARRFLARPGHGPDERVLVLGGDHGSVSDVSRFIPGTTVSGDAAIGVLVHADGARSGTRYRYVSGAIGRDAQFHRNLKLSREEAALFGQVCCDETVHIMADAAQAGGFGLDQVDWVMPHLSNRMFWRSFASRSGIPKERICLDLMPEQGHTFGTDALMALEHADRSGQLRVGDRCALTSIGQGAYFQTVIVEIAEETAPQQPEQSEQSEQSEQPKPSLPEPPQQSTSEPS